MPALSRQPGIQSIARAASVLRAIGEAPEGVGLAELAAAADLPKSTVHRLVGALSQEQLLDSAPDGRIVLGVGLHELAAAAPDPLPERLRPVLEQLAQELGETVDLAVLEGASVRFLDQVGGSHRLRAVSSVGASFPAYCTANGKALLASLPVETVRALLPERLAKMTANTISTRARLQRELVEVRAAGVAFDREEHSEGICAVGAAIAGTGRPAALSVPVPATRFHGREQHYAQALMAATERASRLLTVAR